MSVGSRIWHDEVTARRNAASGETIKVIGRTWITAPHGITEAQLRVDLAELIRPTPRARTSDPDTSHLAAAKDRTSDQERALTILRQHPAGLTDDALAVLMDRRPTSAGKRRLELLERGLVERTNERRPTRTGSTAIVWRAVAS